MRVMLRTHARLAERVAFDRRCPINGQMPESVGS